MDTPGESVKVRLNKFLSQSGVASRREADRMIEAGRIRVNGRVVSELGCKVDSRKDQVEVDGKKIPKNRSNICVLLNKPPGYVVSLKDPFHKNTIVQLLSGLDQRVFPVGRLDKNSQGLLLLTNNGELAHRLMHPRYKIKKEYLVEVKGHLDRNQLSPLEKGILLDGKMTAPANIRLLSAGPRRSVFRIELHEGRKREIRRMVMCVGYKVLSLKRIRYAGLTLRGLKSGCWRLLSEGEYNRLRRLTGLEKNRLS